MYTAIIPRHRQIPYQHYPFSPRAPVVATPFSDLTAIRGKSVLLLLDAENLVISCRNNLGRELDVPKLGMNVMKTARRASMHAFFTEDASTNQMSIVLNKAGWTIHERQSFTLQGRQHRNSDGRLLIQAGVLISRSNADLIILGSGDGELGLELLNFINSLRRPIRPKFMTLSVAGATNRALDARHNHQIAANLEVGLDLTIRRTSWIP